MIGRAVTALLLVCGIGAASAGPAQASFFATGTNPAGNSADPANAERDLTEAAIGYDRNRGVLRAAVRLAGPAGSAPTFIGVFAGTRGPQGCNVYPAIGVSFITGGTDPQWHRLEGPGTPSQSGRVTMRTEDGGKVLLFEAESTRLEGVTPNCMIATLTDPGAATTVFDGIGPVDLIAQPDLGVEFGSMPDPFATGRSRQVKLTIRNTGDASAPKVKLRFKQAKGIKISPSKVTVGSIKAGAKRVVKVRITPSTKAKRTTDLTAIAASGKFEAQTKTEITHRKRKAPSSGGGGSGGGGGGSQTCVRWIPDFSGESGGSLGLVPC